MPDYSQAKIYKIEAPESTTNIYIGSTTKTINVRFSHHKASYKLWLAGHAPYCTAYEILQYPDAQIIEIEAYPCTNRLELTTYENTYIDGNSNCVNKNSTKTKDRKSYEKAYYLDNIEKITEYKKAYMQIFCVENKEKMRANSRAHYIKHKEEIRAHQKANYYAKKCANI